ncbi:DNA breaking-rejoining enzyme, partial [Phlegmacium glaucopus]
IHKVLQKGWADVTINRYSSALQEFMRFCDLENIPNHFRLPADEFVLCAFAASSAGKHAGDTARGKISAIKAWHTIHNVVWKGSARLRYVLNGVDRLAPAKSTKPPRMPINAAMLTQLINALDLSNPLDAAFAACAATAFWGQCRLGELLPTRIADSSTLLLPSRTNLKRSPRNPSAYMLHLPHTKTHHRGQDVVIVEQQGPINPISLLKNHLHLSHTPHTLPLFAYATHEGHQSFTKRTFLRRCNLIWHSLGYPHTTGHCFRIGGTTELLVAGTPPDVVKAMGRWSSDSFHRYWR